MEIVSFSYWELSKFYITVLSKAVPILCNPLVLQFTIQIFESLPKNCIHVEVVNLLLLNCLRSIFLIFYFEIDYGILVI